MPSASRARASPLLLPAVHACLLALLLSAAAPLATDAASAPRAARQASARCPDVLDPHDAARMLTQRVINGNPAERAGGHLALSSPAHGATTVRRCTGVRLSMEWALTAAHCAITTEWTVLAATTTSDVGLPLSVAAVIRHPRYKSPTDRRFDLALLRLVGPPGPVFALSSNPSVPADGAFVRVAGFGTDPAAAGPREGTGSADGDHDRGAKSTDLRHVDIPVVPHDECARAYAGSPNLGMLDSSRQVCAGYPAGVCDACSGDSGGPVSQFAADGSEVAVALVSAAAGCAREGYPGINVRIAPLIPWIKEQGAEFEVSTPVQQFVAGNVRPPESDAEPSPEPTVTPSPSPSPAAPSPSPSESVPPSPSPVASSPPPSSAPPSPSPSESQLPPSPSKTPRPTRTQSQSPEPSPSISAAPSTSLAPSKSLSPSQSPSPSASLAASPSPSPVAPTPTPSQSASASVSASASASSTVGPDDLGPTPRASPNGEDEDGTDSDTEDDPDAVPEEGAAASPDAAEASPGADDADGAGSADRGEAGGNDSVATSDSSDSAAAEDSGNAAATKAGTDSDVRTVAGVAAGATLVLVVVGVASAVRSMRRSGV